MDSNRHVLDWIHAGNYQGVWGALVLTGFGGLMLAVGFPLPALATRHPLVMLLACAAIGYAVGRTIGYAVLHGSGTTAQQVYMPGAQGSYSPTHSNIDALEAQGNHAGAVDAWEKVAIAHPNNPWPLIRAGELYMRMLGDPALALERFRGAQQVPGINPEHHIYVSQKIIDLYLGPLNDHGRALVELSRFVHVHAGTREAAHARVAIARIKAERASD